MKPGQEKVVARIIEYPDTGLCEVWIGRISVYPTQMEYYEAVVAASEINAAMRPLLTELEALRAALQRIEGLACHSYADEDGTEHSPECPCCIAIEALAKKSTLLGGEWE